MRIVISAPRKSGGAHLRCMLSMAYDLKAAPVSAPERQEQGEIGAWLAELPEQSVSTCDLPYSTLVAPAQAADVRLVGIVRHPFDLLVSNFDVAQQRAARGREDAASGHAWGVLAGADLTGDLAMQYAGQAFASDVSSLRGWMASSSAVRFEDLLVDPAAALRSLTGVLGPLTDEKIGHAVDLCPAENVVASRPGQGRRMPALPPGSWRERMPSSLLALLRERYGADVAELGYDVS